MAGGSSYRSKDHIPRETVEIKSRIPRRATRYLQDPAAQVGLEVGENGYAGEAITDTLTHWGNGAVELASGQTGLDDERAVVRSERRNSFRFWRDWRGSLNGRHRHSVRSAS